jgi:hypothetical protein
MLCCDICGQTSECIEKEIDGKEFYLCDRCWRPLAEKLSGKGHLKESLQEMEEFEEYEETLI